MNHPISHQPLRGAVRQALFCLGLGLVVVPAAQAAEPVSAIKTYSLSIAASSLDVALTRLSRETGVSIVFEQADLLGKNSPAVQGDLSTREALSRLLAGSGLQAVALGDGGYRLVPGVDAGAALELGATSVTGNLLGETTEGSGSYTTGSVSIGKAPQSIKETPQTVSVMSRQRIEDQSLTTLADVMAQTTGITRYEGSMTSSRYLSRGFEITNFRVDGGAAMTDSLAWSDLDMAIYDRAEVLRGSDGLFAGAGEPGGTINLVRKRPTAESQYSVTTSASRWDNYRLELDASGPLAFDGKLRGRTVVVSQTRDSFIDYAGSDRALFYGVLEADLSEDTTVLGGITHDRLDASDQAYGLPRYSTGDDLKLSRSTFLAGADDMIDRTLDSYFLRIEQKLGENWSASLDGVYSEVDGVRDYYNFAGSADPITGSGVYAGYGYSNMDTRERSLDLSVKGGFDLFGLQHDLLAGWMWRDTNIVERTKTGDDVIVPNIFAFDPTSYPSQRHTAIRDTDIHLRTRADGFYTSLRMQLAEPLHWIVGGSLTNYQYSWELHELITDGLTRSAYDDENVFVPYTGLTYDLTPEWTAYGSVSDIYKSQADRLKGPSPGTDPLDPITGRTYEIGLKGELFDGRLNTYTALYYTKREDQAVRDPAYPAFTDERDGASCCFLPNGVIVSKGIDFEVSGEVLPRLQATFGYTYSHIRNQGSSVTYSSLTPKHLAKLFATYQMPGVLSNLKVGGGVTAQSASYVTGDAVIRDANGKPTDQYQSYAFSQPGYALWNAFANYRFDEHWSAGLNFDNIFDKKYYSTVGYSDYASFYGEPRSYTVTLRGAF